MEFKPVLKLAVHTDAAFGGKWRGLSKLYAQHRMVKKNLETFAGSYTELKHDTVLYAKQVMAEMGGGELPQWDDRGYVEPEVTVWKKIR